MREETEDDVMRWKAEAEKTIEIDAKCMDNRQEAFGITNLGQLIPCCWADNQFNRKDKDYQKLLMASHITDYDTIEEIFETEEWINFFVGLKENKGFAVCYNVCKKRESPQHKKEVFVNKDGEDYVRAT